MSDFNVGVSEKNRNFSPVWKLTVYATRPGLLPHLDEIKKGCVKYLNCVTQKPSWNYLSTLNTGKITERQGNLGLTCENCRGPQQLACVPQSLREACVHVCLRQWSHKNIHFLKNMNITLKTVQLSLCLMNFMLRECDSECCDIYYDASVSSAQRLCIFTVCGRLLELFAVSAVI